MTSNIVVIIIFSLFLFYLCFCTSFGYGDDQKLSSTTTATPPKEQPELLSTPNLSQNHDPNNRSNADFSTLLKNRDNVSVSHIYQASIEYLGAHAGYYTIEHNYNAKLFYFFFKSQRSTTDPVVIWLNGGPGASSTIGLFYENGPFTIDDGSFLLPNTNSWDQKFFQDDRVRYLENNFFITGQSYAGHYASALALRIQHENKVSGGFTIKLKGMALGNALIDLGIQYATIPYIAWKNNSITKEQYLRMNSTIPTCTSFVESCGPGNENSCLVAFANCDIIFRNVLDTIKQNIGVYINYVYEALKGDWAKDTRRTLSILLDDGIKVLSYNGEFDLICNYLGAMKVILDLPWSGGEKFKRSNVTPFMVDNQEVGLRRTYENLTYLKIYDVGHMVPMDQPRVSLEMIRRWMEGEI